MTTRMFRLRARLVVALASILFASAAAADLSGRWHVGSSTPGIIADVVQTGADVSMSWTEGANSYDFDGTLGGTTLTLSDSSTNMSLELHGDDVLFGSMGMDFSAYLQDRFFSRCDCDDGNAIDGDGCDSGMLRVSDDQTVAVDFEGRGGCRSVGRTGQLQLVAGGRVAGIDDHAERLDVAAIRPEVGNRTDSAFGDLAAFPAPDQRVGARRRAGSPAATTAVSSTPIVSSTLDSQLSVSAPAWCRRRCWSRQCRR